MSFQHGSKSIGENEQRSFTVNDPFHVFTKIANTPAYWKQKKMELLAKLDNFGPFQFFFTLSCADARWDENFTSSMHELGIKVTYEVDQATEELNTILTIGQERILLEEYLTDRRFTNDTRHAKIRKNI